jgi:hypothetical protein
MKAHLLNWALGPAFLGAVFASSGSDPPAAPALDAWLGGLRAVAGLAGFFGAVWLVALVLRIIAQRLNEGRFVWAEVRLVATVMAVKVALLVFALAVLLGVYQLAVNVLGGGRGGWRAAAVGAVVGAVVGLPAGLGVARLRLPQRLGLDRGAGPPAETDDGLPGRGPRRSRTED